MKRADYEVVVVGAGAAGIGCGVVLRDLGVQRFAILERYEVGASFRRWPAETRLLTPSFTTNGFGMLDPNAIALQTSPAYSLRTEHPTGSEYARYLEGISKYFRLPVRSGVEVLDVQSGGEEKRFTLRTNRGTIRCRFLVWATGEFQFPDLRPFPGAVLCRHYATVPSWSALPGEEFVVIGGYESGMDAAVHLARSGRRVTVVDPAAPWASQAPDPSLSLSPFTLDRLREIGGTNRIQFVAAAAEEVVQTADGRHAIQLTNGERLLTAEPPILATGFSSSLGPVANLFERQENGSPLVTEAADESTITPGLFLSGPMLRHDKVIFCFIYKFRQRFAVIGNAIAQRLGLDTAVLEQYRQASMYLDDLSCCGVACAC